mgnify:CR=1 FL=1
MKYKASNGLEIDLEIIRKNNKNIYFRIKDDLKLYVTCPIYLSSRSINNLIKENEESILRMYDKALKKSKDNELFQYLGQKYYVVLQNDSEITFKDNFVYAPSMDALNEFYNKEVERIFTREVEIAKKCFTQLPEFSLKFRSMLTRWGVCNRSKMTVTLNTELLKKDIELLDYVIIHELCHFFEGNHGKSFWHLVELAYPNYKEARKRLKE